MYLSAYYSSLNVEILPGSAVGGRLEFAGILIVAGGGLRAYVHVAICGHYFSPAVKASPAELPILQTSLLPTSPKARFLQIWVMILHEVF